MKEKNDPFNQKSIKVPAFKTWISQNDKHKVQKSLDQTMLTLGPSLEQFEKLFSKYTGSKYAIAVSNCTAALHLSLKALGISKGDEVILPDLNFIADANAILAADAIPVIADIEKSSFFLSLESIKKNISKKTKAIIPLHIYGESCNIGEIKDLARKNDLFIIEDCAHAIGTFFKKKHVGNFGSTGCFSFYPTKNITTGEGGMVITNSFKIANKIKQLRSHGMSKSLSKRYSSEFPWIFDVKEPGYNYRLDEMSAALGISQLQRINKMNELRKKAAEFYERRLRKIPGINTPKIVKDKSHSYHLYTICISKEYGLSRNTLFKILKKNGIRTTLHWRPLHEFSAYKKFVKNKKDLVNTIKTYEQILSLPLYPTISRNHQKKVIKCILKNHKK